MLPVVSACGFIAIAAAAPVFSGQEQQHRTSTDPPTVGRGKLGSELFIAVGRRDQAQLKSLLGQGADVDARNGLEFTPLYIAAASFNMDAMNTLIAAGADVNADSPYGTALLFAALTGNTPGAKILLDKGADPKVVRADSKNALMLAANAGATPIVSMLVVKGVDVNATDTSGSTALIYAARNGHVETGIALLAAGADIEAKDAEGLTPLMTASMTGQADFVTMLMKHGAKSEAKDAKGRTALLLCANYGDSPGAIKALRVGGADMKATDSKGRTAARLAADHGYRGALSALGSKLTPRTKRTTRQAAQAAMQMVDASLAKFIEGAACLSCHHEGLGRWASGVAREHGLKTSPQVAKAQSGRCNGVASAIKDMNVGALKDPEAMKRLPLTEINELADGYAWLLAGMAGGGDPRDEAKGAMAMVMARQQLPDGSYLVTLPRVPLQGSLFTVTALAVKGMNHYGPAADKREIAERTAKARKWLATAEAKTSDDKAFRLLGLKWSGAGRAEIKRAADAIKADQHQDGSWSQVPGIPGDAYATGLALYALHAGGGVAVDSTAYAKGVKFLVRTQDDDGTWFVAKRAIPANNYMDTGYPHGESQYASFDGACWAIMALSQGLSTK